MMMENGEGRSEMSERSNGLIIIILKGKATERGERKIHSSIKWNKGKILVYTRYLFDVFKRY